MWIWTHSLPLIKHPPPSPDDEVRIHALPVSCSAVFMQSVFIWRSHQQHVGKTSISPWIFEPQGSLKSQASRNLLYGCAHDRCFLFIRLLKWACDLCTMACSAGLWLDTREEQLCKNRCLLQSTDVLLLWELHQWEKVSISLWPTCLLILQQSQQSRQEASGIIHSGSRWLATFVSKLTPQTVSNCCPPRSVPPAPPPPGPAAVFGYAERWMKGLCVCFPTQTVRRQVESRGGSVWVWRTLVPSLETFQAYVRKNCSTCQPNGATSFPFRPDEVASAFCALQFSLCCLNGRSSQNEVVFSLVC